MKTEIKWNYNVPELKELWESKVIIFEFTEDFRTSEDFKKLQYSCYYCLAFVFGHKKPYFCDVYGILGNLHINENNWKKFIKRWIELEEII